MFDLLFVFELCVLHKFYQICVINKAICGAKTSSFCEVSQVIESLTVSVSVYDLHEKDHEESEDEKRYFEIEASQVGHSKFFDI